MALTCKIIQRAWHTVRHANIYNVCRYSRYVRYIGSERDSCSLLHSLSCRDLCILDALFRTLGEIDRSREGSIYRGPNAASTIKSALGSHSFEMKRARCFVRERHRIFRFLPFLFQQINHAFHAHYAYYATACISSKKKQTSMRSLALRSTQASPLKKSARFLRITESGLALLDSVYTRICKR